MTMSSKGWGIAGAVACIGGYELLNYGVGRTSACIFAAALVPVWAAVTIYYRSRVAKLRKQLSALTPEDRERVLAELGPELRKELRK